MNSVLSIVLAICFSPALTGRSYCSLWGPLDCVDKLRQPAADARHYGSPRGVLKLDTAVDSHHLCDTWLGREVGSSEKFSCEEYE